jgi:hypothetical protein
MDSPLPERRAVPAGVYETQVVFTMNFHQPYRLGGMLCIAGVRHQSCVCFKNGENISVFKRSLHVVSNLETVPRAEKKHVPRMSAILKMTGILTELLRKVYNQDRTTEKVKPTWSGAWFRQLKLIL